MYLYLVVHDQGSIMVIQNSKMAKVKSEIGHELGFFSNA